MKNDCLRAYIGDGINIDGRMIGCTIVNAHDYLKLKNNWTNEQVECYIEDNATNYEIYELINQILALKHSHWLMRRTSYSCGSLADGLFYLRQELMIRLKDDYNYDFNEEWVDSFGAGTI